MTHEKIEILNYDTSIHGEHVFRLDGTPGDVPHVPRGRMEDPRASKTAFTTYTAIAGNEKNFRFGPILARFCMGIWSL